MADIAPLTPLRYDLTRLAGGLAGVVAPPYDVIDARERAELAARDPHNVVRLILPEGDGDAKYVRTRRASSSWRSEGMLARAPTSPRSIGTIKPSRRPAARGRAAGDAGSSRA